MKDVNFLDTILYNTQNKKSSDTSGQSSTKKTKTNNKSTPVDFYDMFSMGTTKSPQISQGDHKNNSSGVKGEFYNNGNDLFCNYNVTPATNALYNNTSISFAPTQTTNSTTFTFQPSEIFSSDLKPEAFADPLNAEQTSIYNPQDIYNAAVNYSADPLNKFSKMAVNRDNFIYRPSRSQVNPKQAEYIERRSKRRMYLNQFMEQHTEHYTHESRHKHAMSRMRAPSGRFLTKEETEEVLRKQSQIQRNQPPK